MKALLVQGLGWGALLWLIGYLLGFAAFFVVPVAYVGLAIAPFALAVTLWVAVKKLHGPTLGHFIAVGLIWTVIAVVLDYFLLVRLLHPADGYYKLDVYFYYLSTFVIPVATGWWKRRRP